MEVEHPKIYQNSKGT